MNKVYEACGIHAFLNGQFYDEKGQREPNFELLNNIQRLDEIITSHLLKAGVGILSRQAHQFEPQGVTITYALSESHATIHTYPETGGFFMDIFTCGRVIDPRKAAILIAKEFGCSYKEHVQIRTL